MLQSLSAGNNAFDQADFGSIVRLGVTTNTIAADGTVNFNGQMDNVQIYNQSLSAAQVAALYQGKTLLARCRRRRTVRSPTAQTLDLGGAVQQVAGLSGSPARPSQLGSGQLIVSGRRTRASAGHISGVGGSLVKTGSGTLTLSGANSYTGSTTISGGTLKLSAPVNGSVANGGDRQLHLRQRQRHERHQRRPGRRRHERHARRRREIVPGRTGNAVSLAGGATVNINNPITDLGHTGDWTVTPWVKTTTAGGAILTKSDGGWATRQHRLLPRRRQRGRQRRHPQRRALRWRLLPGLARGARPSSTAVAPGHLRQSGRRITRSTSTASFNRSRPTTTASRRLTWAASSSLARPAGAGDGAVNFNGLLDDVQFYSRALSAEQITALYNGLTLGPLPGTTTLQIDAGATLDVNGVVQQVGALNGVAGSAITLGNGRLIINAAGNNAFAGASVGAGGSLVKQGAGTLALGGANTYTGGTIVRGGTLVAQAAAQNAILAEPAGVDIQAGKLVLDYAGGDSPAPLVASILAGGYVQPAKFSTGVIRDSVLPAGRLLGWRDVAATQTLTVLATVAGDTNLDLAVNFTDLLALAQNYGGASKVWSEGDSNYDGVVNFSDLLALAQNYGTSAGGASPVSAEQFAADWALAQTLVPEPTTFALLSTTLLGLRRRR